MPEALQKKGRVTHFNPEVFKSAVFRQPLAEFRIQLDFTSRVLEEGPELLQSVQLTYKKTQEYIHST